MKDIEEASRFLVLSLETSNLSLRLLLLELFHRILNCSKFIPIFLKIISCFLSIFIVEIIT